MYFKTHVDADGGGSTYNQAGWGISAEIAAPIGIENEANTSSTPKPRYIPTPPKNKGMFTRTRNGRNKKSPVPPPGLPKNAAPAPAQNTSRRNSARTPPPPPDPLLSMSILDLRRKIRVLQNNQDTHITKILDMKADNKQPNREYNNKDANIQGLKANTSKIIATSLNKNNNRIKAMSDLHRVDIFMTDQNICEQAKELQE